MNLTNQSTNSIIKRFCKDYSLPIVIFQEPIFSYFIELYDPLLQTKQKQEYLHKYLNSISNIEDFFTNSNLIISNIQNFIKSSSTYQKMNDLDLLQLSKSICSSNIQITNKNIYIEENNNKHLTSIDLKKANFNVFNFLGFKEETNIQSYEELVTKFINNPHSIEYYLNSKMLRQVIFGDLNPARQQKIQKIIIHKFCELLQSKGLELSSASSDEIIINSKENPLNIKKFLEDNTPHNMHFFRVENIYIQKIHPDKDFFIKETVDSQSNVLKTEFKNVPSYFFPQVYKQYSKQNLHEYDLLFYHEGFQATFKEQLFPKENLTKKIKP